MKTTVTWTHMSTTMSSVATPPWALPPHPTQHLHLTAKLIRPTRTTRRQIIESEGSVSGGENDDEDIVMLSDGCVTQEARLLGRQTGGAGAAIRLPSSTSRSQEFRYEQMALREKREAEPTEQLPVEC